MWEIRIAALKLAKLREALGWGSSVGLRNAAGRDEVIGAFSDSDDVKPFAEGLSEKWMAIGMVLVNPSRTVVRGLPLKHYLSTRVAPVFVPGIRD